jgi:hypothetical protein
MFKLVVRCNYFHSAQHIFRHRMSSSSYIAPIVSPYRYDDSLTETPKRRSPYFSSMRNGLKYRLNYTSPKLYASTGNVVENTIGTVSAPPLAVASELNVDKLVESITSKIKCEMQVS